jgi:hypothetical protein
MHAHCTHTACTHARARTHSHSPLASSLTHNTHPHTLCQILEDLDFADADTLLLREELERREALIASAEDEETKEAIRALFARIASEREEKRGSWEERLQAKSGSAAAGEAGAAGGKEKKRRDFDFRRGWDDKRAVGEAPPPQQAAAAASAGAEQAAAQGGEAAAAAAAAATEAGAKEAGSSSSSTAAAGAGDALTAMASAAVFNVDPSTLTPEQFDAAYAAHCKERAAVEWAALQEVKEDAVLGSLWK